MRKLAKSFESQLVSSSNTLVYDCMRLHQVRPKPPPVQPDLHLPSSLEDEHIPFPRTSGVSFCPNGKTEIIIISHMFYFLLQVDLFALSVLTN